MADRVARTPKSEAKQLTPAEKVRLLRVVHQAFEYRMREIRREQYRIVAKNLVQADQKRAEELLRSIGV